MNRLPTSAPNPNSDPVQANGDRSVSGVYQMSNSFIPTSSVQLPVITRSTSGGRYRPRSRSGRGRSSLDESDDDSDFESNIALSHTLRSTSQTSYQDRNEYDFDSSEDETFTHGDGPMIDSILGKIYIDETPNYLVKQVGIATFHATYLPETEIRNGADSHKKLSRYINNSKDSIELLSNLGVELIEISESPADPQTLYADYIISQRIVDTTPKLPSEFKDPTRYIPSVPTDVMPKIQNILKFQESFLQPDLAVNSFLGNDGFFTMPILPSDLANLSNEEEDELEKYPQKTEYLIKWRNQSVSDSTWESPDIFEGISTEPFVIANVPELNYMIETYNKFISRPSVQEKELKVPQIQNKLNRATSLTYNQFNLVKSIFQCKIDNTPCSILSSDRVIAVVAYLQHLKIRLNHFKPTLIITTIENIQTWIDAFKIFTSLYFIDFTGSSNDIQILKMYTFFNDRPRCDVLITTDSIYKEYETENQLFKTIEWEDIILDRTEVENIPIAPFKILIAKDSHKENYNPIENIIDCHFQYTEIILPVPNVVASTMHTRIRTLFKSKSTRHSTVRNSSALFMEIAMAHIHPFTVTSLHRQLLSAYKAQVGISPTANLPMSFEISFLSSSTAKLQKLVIIATSQPITVVVAISLSILRIIHRFLQLKNVPCGLLNSNLKSDQIPEDFTEGIILMTRDYRSPVLEKFDIKQVIFYDVGFSFQEDENLVRFISRKCKQAIKIYRLITDNSVEIEIYIQSFKHPEGFIYTNLDNDEAEPLIRVAAMTTQPDFEPPPLPNEIEFVYPNEAPSLKEKLHSVIEMVDKPDFWDTIFKNSVVAKPKQFGWKNRDAVQLFFTMLRDGLDSWDKIAETYGKPLEEIQSFGQSTLLALISKVEPHQLPNYNVANVIIWNAIYGGAPYGDEFSSSNEYWTRKTLEDVNMQTPVFLESNFKKLIAKNDLHLRTFEKNWLIKTFLCIRSPPYMPPRFFSYTNEYSTKSDFFYSMLHKYLLVGEDMRTLCSLLALPVSYNILSVLSQAFLAISIDIYSYVFHKLQDGKYDELMQHPYLKVYADAYTKGPFYPDWTTYEHQTLINTLYDYYIPLDKDLQPDWAEFHSLTQLNTKTTDMIKNYTEFILKCMDQHIGHSPIVIDAKSKQVIPGHKYHTATPLVIPGDKISTLKNVFTVMQYVRKYARTGNFIVKPLAYFPKTWTKECDVALMQGICQFGQHRGVLLGKLDPTVYSAELSYDCIQSLNLGSFDEIINNNMRSLMQSRIKFIVNANLPMKRLLVFWGGPVRKITFSISPGECEGIIGEIKRKRKEAKPEPEKKNTSEPAPKIKSNTVRKPKSAAQSSSTSTKKKSYIYVIDSRPMTKPARRMLPEPPIEAPPPPKPKPSSNKPKPKPPPKKSTKTEPGPKLLLKVKPPERPQQKLKFTYPPLPTRIIFNT